MIKTCLLSMQLGWGSNIKTHVRIYTAESPKRLFTQYMTTHIYPQIAHTYTSENMWFPLTKERAVHVAVETPLAGNTYSEIFVTGFR